MFELAMLAIALVGLGTWVYDQRHPPKSNDQLPPPRKYQLPPRPKNDDPGRWYG